MAASLLVLVALQSPDPAILVQDRSSDARVRELIQRLGDPSYDEREKAESQILEIGRPAIPLLQVVRRHEDPEVRQRVATILEAIPFWEILGPEAARRFGRASGPDRIRAIVRRTDLGDLEEEEGRVIARAILDGFAWREQYEVALHQKELFDVRQRCWNGPLLLSWVFVEMTEHEHAAVRLAGVQGLRHKGGRERAPFIARLWDDPDADVRRRAAEVLGFIHADDQVATLGRMRGDGDPEVRWASTLALGEITGSSGAVVEALKDRDPNLRARAAATLADGDHEGALSALKEALGVETSLRTGRALQAAVRSLERVQGRKRLLKIISSWSGPSSPIVGREFRRIRTPEQYRKVWSRHSRHDAPDVDFSEAMIVAIYYGRTPNCRGIGLDSVWEDDEKIVLQIERDSYQTLGGADEVAPYGYFVIPASTKPIVIDVNVQGLKGEPPIWEELARIP